MAPSIIGDDDDPLTNFASGVTASDQVKTDLLKAHTIGSEKAVVFVKDRLV